jgi:hypothetical protein
VTVDSAIEIAVQVSRRLADLCGSPSLKLFGLVLTDLVRNLAPEVELVVSPELFRTYARQLWDGHKLLASAIKVGNVAGARRAQASLNIYFIGAQSELFDE